MRRFFIEEHPSDLLISAEGENFCDLVLGIMEGVLSSVIDSRKGCRRKEERIKVSFTDREELFISLLNELIFLLYYRHYIPLSCQYEMREDEATFIFSGLKCQKIKFSLEIKSATYHDLLLDLQGEKKAAKVLFDV